MKTIKSELLILCLLLFYMPNDGAKAETWYVSPNGSGAPGTNWVTAFHQIQQGVIAAGPGDLIRVGNGVYDTGGAGMNSMSNRVAVTNSITVESENGPEYTSIVGAGPPDSSAVRCVYISNGGALIGFTLTNGHSRSTGDVYFEQSGGGVWLDGGSISNCVLTGNRAVYGGGINCYSNGTVRDCVFRENTASLDGGAIYVDYGGVFSDCILTGNTADVDGGGVYFDYGGMFSNCTISENESGRWGGGAAFHQNGILARSMLNSNSAFYGGGVNCSDGGVINDCTFNGNVAYEEGGAVYVDDMGTFFDCSFNGNVADYAGGGVYFDRGGEFNRCTLISNSALYGGAVNCYSNGVLNNCILTGNWANQDGGGVYIDFVGMLNHCSLSGNAAGDDGGGVYCDHGGILNNSIVWGNAQSNWFGMTTGWTNCCTQPTAGVDCMTNNPEWIRAGDFHLQTNSPCIDAASPVVGIMTDKEGTPRPLDGNADEFAAPDIGAYEFISTVADTDGDSVSDFAEYVADTDSTDAGDWFHISTFDAAGISFLSSQARQYSLLYCTNLVEGSWLGVPGQTHVTGTDSMLYLSGSAVHPACFFRVEVELP